MIENTAENSDARKNAMDYSVPLPSSPGLDEKTLQALLPRKNHEKARRILRFISRFPHIDSGEEGLTTSMVHSKFPDIKEDTIGHQLRESIPNAVKKAHETGTPHFPYEFIEGKKKKHFAGRTRYVKTYRLTPFKLKEASPLDDGPFEILKESTNVRAEVLAIIQGIEGTFQVSDLNKELTDPTSVTEIERIARVVKEHLHEVDARIVQRQKKEARGKVFESVRLPDGILQTIHHDFADPKFQSTCAVLRIFGHLPRKKGYTVESLMGEMRRLDESCTVTEGPNRTTYFSLIGTLNKLIALTAIPEIRTAYGFQVSCIPGNRKKKVRNHYTLETVAMAHKAGKRKRTITRMPKYLERKKEVTAKDKEDAYKEIGTQIERVSEQKARELIARGTFALHEEQGELEAVYQLMEASECGKYAVPTWPIEIEMDIPSNAQIFHRIEARTKEYSRQLGFFIHSTEEGYYTIIFLRHTTRQKSLAKKVKDPIMRSQYNFHVTPFDREIFKQRLAKTGNPESQRSIILEIIGDAQASGEFLMPKEVARRYKEQTGDPRAIKTITRDHLPKIEVDTLKKATAYGFHIQRRSDKRLAIVLLDMEEIEKKEKSGFKKNDYAPKSKIDESLRENNALATIKRKVGSVKRTTFEEEIELGKAIKEGRPYEGKNPINILVERNLKFALSKAYSYYGLALGLGLKVDIIDLFQEGVIGMIRAAKKYDYELGWRYGTYAGWWIKQAMLRYIQDTGRTIRVPVHMFGRRNEIKHARQKLETELKRHPSDEEVAEELNMSIEQVEFCDFAMINQVGLDDFVAGKDSEQETRKCDLIPDSKPSAETRFSKSRIRTSLSPALYTAFENAGLNQEEIFTLEHRFELGGADKLTFEAIGEHLGVSRQAASKKITSAIGKLQTSPQAAKLLRPLMEATRANAAG